MKRLQTKLQRKLQTSSRQQSRVFSLRMQPKAPHRDKPFVGLGEELTHLAYHGMSEKASKWWRNFWYKTKSIPDFELTESKERELWSKLDKENVIILQNASSAANNNPSASVRNSLHFVDTEDSLTFSQSNPVTFPCSEIEKSKPSHRPPNKHHSMRQLRWNCRNV